MSFEASQAPAIDIVGLGKCYQIYATPRDRLKQFVLPRVRRTLGLSRAAYYREFWSLSDVSFRVRKGETLGVVGRNGAGKSTLLQLICGTLSPTTGSISVDGRVAALLELGAGFNPELTGRENVFMYAGLLGLEHAEVRDRFEEIARFADIGDFIEQPVKTYSSGMYVRLAFSVAACVDPDILIVDEALAVGDVRFQLKCIARINDLRARGTTILFVSHALEQVKRICDRAVWLERGTVREVGYAPHVCDAYEAFDVGRPAAPAATAPAESGHKVGRISALELNRSMLEPFDALTVRVEYEIFDESVEDLLVGVSIRRSSDDCYVFGPNTALEKVALRGTRGRHAVRYEIPRLPLLGGTYHIDAGLFTSRGVVCLDFQSRARSFDVRAGYFSEGLVYIDHSWVQE